MTLLNAWVAAGLGVAVSVVSALIAWLGIRFSARRPGLMFVAVFGGTLLRLVFVGGASVLLLHFYEVHTAGYAVGLIASYLLFLGMEIAIIARSAGRSKPSTPSS